MAYDINQYMPLIEGASRRYGVPKEQIIGTILRESSGNPNAQNGSHYGLGQVSPAVFAEAGVTDRSKFKDPATNINAMARYLGQQTRAFGGDPIKGQAAYVVGAQGLKDMMAGERPWDPQLGGYLNSPHFSNSWNTKEALQHVGYNSQGAGQDSLERITGLPHQNSTMGERPYVSQANPDAYDEAYVRAMQERFAMMGQQPEAAPEALQEPEGINAVDGTIMGLEALLSAFAQRGNEERTVAGQLTGSGTSGWGRNAALAIKQGQSFGSPTLYK